MLARGELTAGHARTLITADDPAALARQHRRWRAVGARGRSARAARKRRPQGEAGPRRPRRPKDAGYAGARERGCPMCWACTVRIDPQGREAAASRSATGRSKQLDLLSPEAHRPAAARRRLTKRRLRRCRGHRAEGEEGAADDRSRSVP